MILSTQNYLYYFVIKCIKSRYKEGSKQIAISSRVIDDHMKTAADAHAVCIVNTKTKQCSNSSVHCRAVLLENISKTQCNTTILVAVFQINFSISR